MNCSKHEHCVCNVAAAFASAGLGIAVAVKFREVNETVRQREYPNYHFIPVAPDKMLRLQEAMRIGQVTVLIANPEPLQALVCGGTFGMFSSVYGVWLERKASFFGKIERISGITEASKYSLENIDLGNNESNPEE